MTDMFFVHDGKDYRITKMQARTITKANANSKLSSVVGAVWDLTVFSVDPDDILQVDSLTPICYGFRFPNSKQVRAYRGFVVSVDASFGCADLLIVVLYDDLQLAVGRDHAETTDD